MTNMFSIDASTPADKVALWPLGQAGYYLKSEMCSVLIDPYLSNSVEKIDPVLTRKSPPPIDPAAIRADIFIVTHDHLDHLDPETVSAYSFKDTTKFVAPRLAAKRLIDLSVPEKNIHVVNCGDSIDFPGLQIKGVFALPTEPEVLDTSGYVLTFANGKSIYHTSDTGFCDLLLKACPKADVLLTCINGKFGNLNISQAIELTRAVNPHYVIPNHYDIMELNAENPESFRFFYEKEKMDAKCVILEALEYFHW